MTYYSVVGINYAPPQLPKVEVLDIPDLASLVPFLHGSRCPKRTPRALIYCRFARAHMRDVARKRKLQLFSAAW